ncbi:MAG: sodium-dependent transporter [Ruminococcus sp.]|nr:sodium-dependent transporter [Ruminococcus sp.]
MASKTDETSSRGGFASKIGFVLAAAGSAVGLGNIWRFPYLAAKYGGGFFLLVYLIFAVTFGFALMLTEISIGRKTGKSVIGAYKEVDKRFSFLGPLAAAIPALILPYYCVIGGWVLKYTASFLTGHGADMAQKTFTAADGSQLTFFENFISHLGQPAIFFIIYVVLTAAVVVMGVEKGIEKVSKFLMPVLLVLIIGIGIYTLTLDGATEGLKYYILPGFSDFSADKLVKTIAAVIGQLFYSMSIAMGIMITYGSYMRKDDSIESSVRQIEVFDTLVAFLAGLIIVPAVFVFSGGNAEALNAGPGLMFITLPKVFDSMTAGPLIGSAFFVLVALAALTSSISLMETVVAVVMEKFKLSRAKSCVVVILLTLVLGMLSVLGYSAWDAVTIIGMQILDFFDFITNNIMMPILALLTCIMVGYVVKTEYIEKEVMHGEKQFRSKLLYRAMIKYVCPLCMILILLTPFIFKSL